MNKFIKYIIIGLVTGALNGLFGSGGGTVVVPAMTNLLGVEEHKAHSTAISIILPLTILSAYFYASENFVDWQMTIRIIIGGMAGGGIGAWLLGRLSAKQLRKIFGVFMIIAGTRMLIRT
jgi:uncharacterized membrane protein YfcA